MKGTEDGLSPELSTNQKGAIAEAVITAEAIKLGIDVYRPVVEGGRYDLIFGFGPRLLRVQCKWGVRHGDVVRVTLRTSRYTPRGYVQTKYGPDEVDAVAVYCSELDECYVLPVSLIAERKFIYLRLAPCRNNQRALVHWARQYRLIPGAIAQLGERVAGSHEVAGSSPASSTELTLGEASGPALL
jgi:PD-(D/E)XK nuclease superfamily protein